LCANCYRPLRMSANLLFSGESRNLNELRKRSESANLHVSAYILFLLMMKSVTPIRYQCCLYNVCLSCAALYCAGAFLEWSSIEKGICMKLSSCFRLSFFCFNGEAKYTMMCLLMTLMIVVTTSLGCAATQNATPNINSRIIGGSDAPLGRYPFMASFQTAYSVPNNHHCGGTLISPILVLTAAHCITGAIVVGSEIFINRVSQSDASQGLTRRIHALHIYPDWESGFDIAIVELDSPVTEVQPISLVSSEDDTYQKPGYWVRTIGWGFLHTHFPTKPDLLQQVELPVVLEKRCSELYPGQRVESNLCAGTPGLSTCNYDSGGPLFVQDPATQRFLQIGVTSGGDGSRCEEKEATRFVKLSAPEAVRFISSVRNLTSVGDSSDELEH